ncbi:hypothetical protein XELAEV_18040989mg [Xenopus laevis]|uniref:GRIP1-associated protein 1 n=1 Tax=Xenopus laevis TaxID=8355 RepID=A0A974C1C0_XENLA|nr:hypothetical protein XELAEV_18040989mg [Xenopus laevis]
MVPAYAPALSSTAAGLYGWLRVVPFHCAEGGNSLWLRKMAQALSEEEFQRMQAQLLELRTQNYQLSDSLRKNSQELSALRQKHGSLEKEFGKAQKALIKSKKAQEVEALLGENEMLQGKLHSQEEDFRLQNTTLMQELSKLCTQIEQLEAENTRFKAGQPAVPNSSGEEEVMRLQAENTALQKRITTLQERHEKDIATLRYPESNGHSATYVEDGACASKTLVETDGQANAKQDSLIAGSWEPITEDLQGLKLKLETHSEENRLLRVQIESLQGQMVNLQEEQSKTVEKLKKKHESYLQLQIEKEALYNDSRTKIEELQQKKEEDMKSLTLRNQKLQQDMQAAQQSCMELREQLQSLKQEHERALHGVQEQVAWQSAESQEQVDNILSENDALRTNLAALEQIQSSRTQELTLLQEQNAALSLELQQQHHEMEATLAQKEDLKTQLQESLHANRRLLEQLQEKEQERGHLQQDLDEARKIADKRKAMLDEMAIEMLQEKSRHKDEVGNIKLQHEKEVLSIRAKYEKELRELHEEKNRGEEDLRGQLRDEKARSRELEGLQQKSEELLLQIQSLEGTKGWFERRLKEAEENMEKDQMQHQEDLAKMKSEHSANLKLKDQEVGAITQKLEESAKEKVDLQETINQLRQELKDTADGQRILEKKGSLALKDLKRQLHLERKRAEKLQERLQEILTNSKTRTGLEELVLAELSSPSRAQTGDSSSISSFSYREIMKENATPSGNKSNTGSPQSQTHRPAELSDEEVSDLFQRLAEIQQEKWLLEEKVKHLEVSSASMAEDLCRKSSIIEAYVMDSRIGQYHWTCCVLLHVSPMLLGCIYMPSRVYWCVVIQAVPSTNCHISC